MNERDLAHLRRATSVDAETCSLLHALPPAPAARDRPSSPSLEAIVARLARLDIEVFAIDLRRQAFGVPAARVMCQGFSSNRPM